MKNCEQKGSVVIAPVWREFEDLTLAWRQLWVRDIVTSIPVVHAIRNVFVKESAALACALPRHCTMRHLLAGVSFLNE